jgi:hypothetical protein
MNRREFLIAGVSAGVPLSAWAASALLAPPAAPVIPPPTGEPATSGAPATASPTPTEEPTSEPAPVGDGRRIQADIDALPEGGGEVVVGPGLFVLAEPLRLARDKITLRGTGPGATLLEWVGPGAAIQNADPGVIRRQVTIRDLAITNRGVDGSAGGIALEHCYDTLVDRCRVEAIGSAGVGVEFIGTGSTYFNTLRSSWLDCSSPGSTGIRWSRRTAEPNANRVIDTTVSGRSGTIGFDILAGDTALVMGSAAEGGDILLRAAGAHGQVIGCRFELGPVVVTGDRNRFVGNSYADTSPFDDRGRGTIRVGEP